MLTATFGYYCNKFYWAIKVCIFHVLCLQDQQGNALYYNVNLGWWTVKLHSIHAKKPVYLLHTKSCAVLDFLNLFRNKFCENFKTKNFLRQFWRYPYYELHNKARHYIRLLMNAEFWKGIQRTHVKFESYTKQAPDVKNTFLINNN